MPEISAPGRARRSLSLEPLWSRPEGPIPNALGNFTQADARDSCVSERHSDRFIGCALCTWRRCLFLFGSSIDLEMSLRGPGLFCDMIWLFECGINCGLQTSQIYEKSSSKLKLCGQIDLYFPNGQRSA